MSQQRVYCKHLDTYDKAQLTQAVRAAFALFGFDKETLTGKRVAVKPNLVIKKAPEVAATVHPALIDAVLTVLDGFDTADVVLAESCGGPFNAATLNGVYRTTGMEDAVRAHRARLNDDYTFGTVSCPEGVATKNFNIITAVAQADVIISVGKLKSHALTGMSGAAKNFFGTIPGLQKFEMHARFSDYNEFNDMLVDLCCLHHSRARVLNIQDAIVCMEGNGPTGGSPRHVGCLLASDDAFCLDTVAEQLLGLTGEVHTLQRARLRGVCPVSAAAVTVCGDDISSRCVTDFVRPDSKKDASVLVRLPLLLGTDVFRAFQPHPEVVGKICVGCGECVRSCPVHTIRLVPLKNGKKRAKINPKACIRCYCCQELCPFRAVRIHKNPILRVIG